MNVKFNPLRLIEAREARGIKQTALSSIIGYSTTSISKWENGHIEPDTQSLDAISSALGLPMEWFFQPSLTASSVYHFRSQSAATKTAQEIARIRLRWTAEFANKLVEWVDLPEVNLIPSPSRENALNLTNDEIEAYAQKLREHLGLGVNPIPNLTQLLEASGIIIVCEESGFTSMDGVSAWIDGRPYIWTASDKASCVRSRFDIAHELGHIILHKHLTAEDCNSIKHKKIEDQAHLFAGCFLMPAIAASSLFRVITLDTLLAQKKKWGISVGAMISQCSNANLINEEQTLRLRKNMSFRKWRTREPYDDSMTPEKPILFEKSIKLLLEHGGFKKTDIISRFGLPRVDIEKLAALPNGFLSDNTDQELVQLRRTNLKIV
ncbi:MULTISPECIES: helix-turn-helix domain-containing protein [Acinetobacter]|jgi:Zn-dependent peptidase ImmA (M78 family)/transcriptional regulator with XRE-family HTH domain|uniref:helix-turn-helix domain-containing protein n=1 Tax=Acinetobacter TaxID=469 RepID=UPI00257B7ACE|nr:MULTISPECIES: XRE family transcriptional regulator [Acinetobacter]